MSCKDCIGYEACEKKLEAWLEKREIAEFEEIEKALEDRARQCRIYEPEEEE